MGTAVEIQIAVGTLMHPELPHPHHQHRVPHARDVRRAVDLAADDQRLRHVFQIQCGKGLARAGGQRHVDDAIREVRQRRRGRGVRGRRRQDDVFALVVRDGHARGV